MKYALTTTLLAGSMLCFAAFADNHEEEMASAEEVASISIKEAIAMFNCEVPEEVEKESAELFELDDAVCQGGQYDIKLDENFTVISMTYDGPVNDD